MELLIILFRFIDSKYWVIQLLCCICYHWTKSQLIIVVPKQMFDIFTKAYKLFSTSFNQTALLPGMSDILVTKWKQGQYKSTPFLVCFGYKQATVANKTITIHINGTKIPNLNFTIDKYGYLQPMKPSQQILSKLNLSQGKNTITFTLQNNQHLQCQIYLYDQQTKILISDLDGTLTRSDVPGIFNNIVGGNYLHQGYVELINQVENHGCKVVWLTMRALSLYKFSKQYIRTYIKIQGPLLTQPEQLFYALKKQVTKKTDNIKTNMMRTIKNIFPEHIDPFIGGLGNRQNDAIAYRAAGVSYQNIYLIDTKSKVHRMNSIKQSITYKHMSDNFQDVFSQTTLSKIQSQIQPLDSLAQYQKHCKNMGKKISLKHARSNYKEDL